MAETLTKPPRRIAAWPAFRKEDENPYSRLFADALGQRGAVVREFSPRTVLFRHDAVVVHWPEVSLTKSSRMERHAGAFVTLLALAYQRLLGARIVWVTHNVEPHESPSPFLQNIFYSAFTRLVDGCIYPSHFSRATVSQRWPRLAVAHGVVIPHGVYGMPSTLEEIEEVEGLLSGGEYLCWFGKLRPYKGIVELMKAYCRLNESRPVLVVAGECSDNELVATVGELASSSDDIVFINRRLSEGELACLVQNCLGVVLPFRSVGNSGSVMYSLSAGTPVAAPHDGAIKEIAGRVGSKWVVPIRSELDAGQLAGVIEAFRHIARATPGDGPPLDWASWDLCAGELDRFLEAL